MMKTLFSLLLLFPISTFAKCDVYYFSLDFGGAIGDGNEIVNYLGQEDVPFTLFLVGKNSSTTDGKKVCEKIRTSTNKKIAIGNHTVGHEGFSSKHTEEHIRQEITGNESYMSQCDSKRVIKYFRYPKGSANTLAEKVLKEAGYLGTYQEFFPQSDASPSNAVWWTTDTRDWVKPTGASAWAQIDYFNKNQKLLPVDQDSWRDLVSTISNSKSTATFHLKMSSYLKDHGSEYPQFEKIENVSGFHGPNADEIAKKVLNDEGKLGKDGKKHCFPLMHYGGINSYAALKKIIPVLKTNKAELRGLGDGDTVHYQLKTAVNDLQNLNTNSNVSCSQKQDSFEYSVMEGDNIYSIARSMINTNKTVCPQEEKSPVNTLVSKIISLNNIKDTNDVLPGTLLHIPSDCSSTK